MKKIHLKHKMHSISIINPNPIDIFDQKIFSRNEWIIKEKIQYRSIYWATYNWI